MPRISMPRISMPRISMPRCARGEACVEMRKLRLAQSRTVRQNVAVRQEMRDMGG